MNACIKPHTDLRFIDEHMRWENQTCETCARGLERFYCLSVCPSCDQTLVEFTSCHADCLPGDRL